MLAHCGIASGQPGAQNLIPLTKMTTTFRHPNKMKWKNVPRHKVPLTPFFISSSKNPPLFSGEVGGAEGYQNREDYGTVRIGSAAI
jgi:hypothetical protein